MYHMQYRMQYVRMLSMPYVFRFFDFRFCSSIYTRSSRTGCELQYVEKFRIGVFGGGGELRRPRRRCGGAASSVIVADVWDGKGSGTMYRRHP